MTAKLLMMKKYITWGLLVCTVLSFASCERYLEVEPKGKLIPTTPEDFRMLLDNVYTMNVTGGLSELGTDNLVMTEQQFNNMSSAAEKSVYTWSKAIYGPLDQASDWNVPSLRIYYANLVLEGLEKNASGTQKDRNTIKGEALFHRGAALYEMVSVYASAYDDAIAETALGTPVRLASDVFPASKRPTMKETYTQLLADLNQALSLLPLTTDKNTRPAKEAAYGLLARINLDMGRYEQALLNAKEALKINEELIDYNSIGPFDYPRFSRLNKEIIFFSSVPWGYAFTNSAMANRQLYDLYDANDLRKEFFFSTYTNNNNEFIISSGGSYAEWSWFSGVARNELYLIASEAYARTNDPVNVRKSLNDLLIRRTATGKFTPVNLTDPDALLTKILLERRKELVFRNRRWIDLKRLNKDPRFAVTLKRTVRGTEYTLAPNSARYVFPIPEVVINATQMPQNER